MLTIFTIPKPFKGDIAVIQRNAITSWTLLRPEPEIIIFGNEEGTAEFSRELNLRHVPDIACNEFGTPLLSDVFNQAQQIGRHDLMCYANADIILMNDLMLAVSKVKAWRPSYVLTGGRRDTALNQNWDFSQTGWEKKLRAFASNEGEDMPWGIDYLVFPVNLFREIPPFAVGRTAFDCWLIWYARHKRVPVIDATASILAIHQNHPHSFIESGQLRSGIGLSVMANSPEVRRNHKLAGSFWKRSFTLADATHQLTHLGLDTRSYRPLKNRLKVSSDYLRLCARSQLRSFAFKALGEERTKSLVFRYRGTKGT